MDTLFLSRTHSLPWLPIPRLREVLPGRQRASFTLRRPLLSPLPGSPSATQASSPAPHQRAWCSLDPAFRDTPWIPRPLPGVLDVRASQSGVAPALPGPSAEDFRALQSGGAGAPQCQARRPPAALGPGPNPSGAAGRAGGLFLSKIPVTQMLNYVHTVPNVQMIYLVEVCFVCGVPWVGCFYSADFFQVYGFLLLFCQCSSFISL